MAQTFIHKDKMTTSPMHNVTPKSPIVVNPALSYQVGAPVTATSIQTESSFTDAKAKYLSKLQGMTKTPREQLNEYKKRNKPPVILKMKMVNSSANP